MEFNSWSPGWRGCDQEWPEWFCPCTASDAGLSPPAPSKHRPAESETARAREKEKEKEKKKRKRVRTGEKEWNASDERQFQNVSGTPIHQQQTYLISWCIVNLSCQALSFGLTGKQVLSLIQTQTENLSIKVIVLIPELMVLLGKEKHNSQRGVWLKLYSW